MAEAPTSVTLYFQSHITPHFVIRKQIIAVSGIKWGNRLDLPWNGISERRQPPQPENAFRLGINGFGEITRLLFAMATKPAHCVEKMGETGMRKVGVGTKG
jgi:hypothetical protein